ncbi:MAG: hypothetical protein AABX77_02965, partial [Nanoarchaeota archaeon]
FGYSFGDVLNRWADLGVFAYVLPFLMIFALVYGILAKTKILGENKGVNATIALAFGLLALQFDYVSGFYASIFPYAGMGLAVLLVALILLGLVTGEGKGMAVNWIWLGIGVVIFIFILFGALGDTYWLGGVGYNLADAAPALLAILIILGLMGLIIWGGGKS